MRGSISWIQSALTVESLLIRHGYHHQFFGFHRMLARVLPFLLEAETRRLSLTTA